MTKEETIDSAYGNYADISKGLRDENGWIPIGCYYTYFPQNSERSECGWFERPKFLQGIENNNGWIKLQGLANEIQDRCSIWIETKNGDIEYLKENEFLPIGYAVAYQVAEKPKKRIY